MTTMMNFGSVFCLSFLLGGILPFGSSPFVHALTIGKNRSAIDITAVLGTTDEDNYDLEGEDRSLPVDDDSIENVLKIMDYDDEKNTVEHIQHEKDNSVRNGRADVSFLLGRVLF